MTRLILLSLLLSLIGFSSKSVLAEASYEPHNVAYSQVHYQGRDAIRVTEPGEPNVEEDKLLIIKHSEFANGEVSLWVNGARGPKAGPNARGFVGLAFRINKDASAFEAVYLRPTNARAENQLRRNHSIQYFSYPDYPWYRLRRETPGKYESYADMQADTWIHYRLVVQDEQAKLYLNHAPQPALIVNDLKGQAKQGRLGFWIGPGTRAHFSDLKISQHQ